MICRWRQKRARGLREVVIKDFKKTLYLRPIWYKIKIMLRYTYFTTDGMAAQREMR